MAETEVRETRSLKEQNSIERDYYLRKTDIVPDSGGKTVAEAKKEYRERVADADANLAERMKRFDRSGEELKAPATDPPINDTMLPGRDELEKLKKDDLIEQAEAEGLTIDPSVKMADIVDTVLSNRKESAREVIDVSLGEPPPDADA